MREEIIKRKWYPWNNDYISILSGGSYVIFETQIKNLRIIWWTNTHVNSLQNELYNSLSTIETE